PGEGHRVPRGDGRARPLREAVPQVRGKGAAHRLRRERDQLLPGLPDRREAAGGPVAVAVAQGRLAEDGGRAGGAQGGTAARVSRPRPASSASSRAKDASAGSWSVRRVSSGRSGGSYGSET